MKKSMIFAALILTTATTAMAQRPTRTQQEESERIVNYYSRQQGFRTVTVGRAVFRLTSVAARLAGERELRQAAACLDNIRVIHLEAYGESGRAAGALLDTRIYCDRYGYDELLVSEEYGTRTEVHCRYTATGDVTGAVVVSRTENEELNIVFLHGEMTARELASLLDRHTGRGFDLASL